MNGDDALRQSGFKVSRYFLDFLETDFKRQQAQRRRIQIRNEANQTTAVPLRKYEALYDAVVALLAKNLTGNGRRELTASRGRYKASINPVLKNLIGQHVYAIEPQKFTAITGAVDVHSGIGPAFLEISSGGAGLGSRPAAKVELTASQAERNLDDRKTCPLGHICPTPPLMGPYAGIPAQ